MTCPTCQSEAKKFGRHRNRLQRFRCKACHVTFTEDHAPSFRVEDYLNDPRGLLAVQLLDEARGLVTRRATNYRQFDAQLNVAHAFAALDPSRSFETLEPGINQINELLSAAAMLSGFEVNIFKEGELPLQTGSSLTGLVMRYGKELASLARIDFEKAQVMTDKFLLPEPRILAKLTMVRGVLGVAAIDTSNNNGFGGGRGGQFGPRPQ